MRVFGGVLGLAMFALVVLLVLPATGATFLGQIPFKLAFGWIGFLGDNLAAMEVNPLLIAEAVVCILALGVGGHWFARWLYREMAPEAPGPWRPGWTVAGLAGVLLLFVAGIATIGITHQAAWLFTAEAPLLEDSWSMRARVSEAVLAGGSLKTGVAETYQNTGRLPASAAEAGINEPFQPTRNTKSVSVGPGGVVRIEVAEHLAGGGIITLTPTPDTGKLKWKCETTLPRRFVPAECR